MAITLQVNSGVVTIPANSSGNVNVIVPSSNLLALAFQGGGNFGFQTPKYNGSGGTLMTLLAAANGGTRESYIHYYPNPAIGSINFYFNNTYSQNEYVLVALFSGVDLSSVPAGTNGVYGSDDDAAVTVSHTYKAGQMAFGAMGNRSNSIAYNSVSNMTSLGRVTQASFGYRVSETDGTTLLNNRLNDPADWSACGAVVNKALPGGANQVIWWFKKRLENKKKEQGLLPFPAGV
jgi:hypothetical protein